MSEKVSVIVNQIAQQKRGRTKQDLRLLEKEQKTNYRARERLQAA